MRHRLPRYEKNLAQAQDGCNGALTRASRSVSVKIFPQGLKPYPSNWSIALTWHEKLARIITYDHAFALPAEVQEQLAQCAFMEDVVAEDAVL